MMWQVFWSKSAERELAEAWLTTTDRRSITEAADQADQLLKRDPLNVGESRQENFRILILSPLVIQYEVSVPDQKVQILQCVALKTR